MKRTLNWYAMTSAYKVLVGDADRTTKIGALRKFLEKGESVDGLLKIMGAVHALAPTMPAILTDEFKTQINKAAWTAYCMKKGYCDFSGRVAKTFRYVCLETGVVCSRGAGTTVEAPSLQTWLPFTENAMVAYCQFSNELEDNALNIDADATRMLRTNFNYATNFYVKNGEVHLIPSTPVLNGKFELDGMEYDVQTALNALRRFERENRTKKKAVWDEPPRMVSDHTIDAFNSLYLLEPSRHVGKARELGMGYGMGPEAIIAHSEAMELFKDSLTACGDKIPELKLKETTDMNMTQKASAFFGNLKAIGADLLRVQRGRATLHSAKRVIFSALPFKWGFLARLTGKAKKVENHPFTDLALAFALHGATSFAITDAAKREKYLKYTEEMLVAAGYSASLKMLPIEDMLDKVFAGVSESEAMTKLKEMVKELPEETGIAAHKPE